MARRFAWADRAWCRSVRAVRLHFMLPLIILVILHFILLGLLIREALKLHNLFKVENRYNAIITSLVPWGRTALDWDENSDATDKKKYADVSFVPIVEFIKDTGEKITIKTRTGSTLFQTWKGKQVEVYYKQGMSSAVIDSPICMWDYLIIISLSYIAAAGTLVAAIHNIT